MRRTKTEDAWFDQGPLGLNNYRRQLGRSFELGGPSGKLKETLVFTGATQRTDPRVAMAARAPGDAAASLVQITCTYRGENTDNAARPLTVRGQVDWGTDGHQSTAYFDWLNGAVVQVSGSFVRVTAEIVGVLSVEDTTPTFDPDAVVTVGATIGYGGATRPPPTLTQQVRLVQDGVDPPQAVLTIPRFARRLWWLGPAPASVAWAAGPTAALELAQIDPLTVSTRQAYERPGVATHVRITGNGGPTPQLNTLTWELVL